MYNNIGGKIKGLATVIAVIGITISVILGIIQIVNALKYSKYSYGISSVQSVTVWRGLLTIGLGSVISVVSTYALYGFGQLIESTQNIERELTSRGFHNAPKAMYTRTEIESNGWKCPKCGKMNPLMFSFCDCGAKKPLTVVSTAEQARVRDAQQRAREEWVCPSCGRVNTSYITTCNCGNPKTLGAFANTIQKNDEWKCPDCGKVNASFVDVCGCGHVKP